MKQKSNHCRIAARFLMTALLLCVVIISASADELNGVEYRIEDGECMIIDYNGSNDHVSIPAKIEGYNVTSIQRYAFENASFSSITLPEGLEFIGYNAFAYCENLTALHLPSTVRAIHEAFQPYIGVLNYSVADSSPFYEAVQGVLYDKGLSKLVRYPVARRDSSFVVSEGVECIDEYAFYQGYSLQEIILPDSVTTIKSRAFTNCSSLEKINLPEQISFIDEYAFQDCGNMVAYVYGGSYAHSWCIENDVDFVLIDKTADLDIESEIDPGSIYNDLTPEEQALIDSGETLMVWLEVSDVSDSIDPEIIRDKYLIESIRDEAVVTHYLDIDLLRQIGKGQNAIRQLTEVSDPIAITITIPPGHREAPLLMQRSFGVIRVHNGQPEKLHCSYDPATGNLTFYSRGFSLYAICYEDSHVADNGNLPQTGDSTQPLLLSMLLIIAAAGMLVLGKRRRTTRSL